MNTKRTFHSTRPRRTALLITSMVGTLTLAVNVISKPPGGEQGPGYLCRADFFDADVNSATALFRVVSDGPRYSCTPFPNDHPLGGSWDYWANRTNVAVDPVCGEFGGGQNDVQSNGGRWI